MKTGDLNGVSYAIGSCVEAIDTSNRWRQEVYVNEQQRLSEMILKIVEEVGEASAAYIGYTGQNVRKGITHTIEDVREELVDVIASTLVALVGTGMDKHEALDCALNGVAVKCVRHARAVAHAEAARREAGQ